MEYVGFDASVTRDGVDRLVQSATRLYPALAGKPILRRWAGLRPVSPDGYPYIGVDPQVQDLWYATGHGRNGVVLAGASASPSDAIRASGGSERSGAYGSSIPGLLVGSRRGPV
jgi:glycine/D-amino acid oxidase-like deaminating enzyme